MKAAYIFSGQGAQTVGMGRDLYESSNAAAAIYNEADSVLGWSISDICFNGPAEKLTESKYCQPAIYTTSMACLAAYREKYDGDPDEIVGCAGLSLGEYAALACAGFFSFANGLKLVARRAELMDEACRKTEGGMAAIIAGDPDVIREVCRECDIDVANYNCPGQIVISGVKDGVMKACGILKEKGVKRALPLNVAGAYHSRLMAEAGRQLRGPLADTYVSELELPVVQNLTGATETNLDRIKENLVGQVASVLTGFVKKIDPSKALLNVSGMIKD